MAKPTVLLRRIRRAVTAICVLLFVLSFAGTLTIGKGQLGATDFSVCVSIDGAIGYIDWHPTSGPRDKQPWTLDFVPESWGGDLTFRNFFDWHTLGFTFHRLVTHGFGSQFGRSITVVILPYWPILIVLLIPEFLAFNRWVWTKPMDVTTEPAVNSSILEHDLPCVHCAYNLRSLQSTAKCPECGLPVNDTLALSTELAKSRPGWLRCLATGNILMLLARLILLGIYISIFSMHYTRYNWSTAALLAIGMSVTYLAATFLLTRREHPHLPSPDHKRVFIQRNLATASLICITGAAGYQDYLFNIRRGLGFMGLTRMNWDISTQTLLILGWLLYCVCVVLEYRYLAKLAGRLLDNFMTEKCRIAGIGAAVSSVLVIGVMPIIVDWFAIPQNQLLFALILGVIVLWILFLVWTGFMNVYCAIRFTQQSKFAAARWRQHNA